VDLWAATQLDDGAAESSVRRRLSALSSFYRYCAAHDLIGRVPTEGVARPVVDPDYTSTVGLDRDQARALVAAADANTGAQALRTAAVLLLLHNALRRRHHRPRRGFRPPGAARGPQGRTEGDRSATRTLERRDPCSSPRMARTVPIPDSAITGSAESAAVIERVFDH